MALVPCGAGTAVVAALLALWRHVTLSPRARDVNVLRRGSRGRGHWAQRTKGR
eukprot:SAG25_NODE_864_length_5017_cov_46.986783_4_plen_53_part_00